MTIFKALTISTLLVLMSFMPSHAMTIKDDGRYVTFTIPAHEMLDSEQEEALKMVLDMGIDRIVTKLPSGMERESMEALNKIRNTDLSETLEDLKYLTNSNDVGFRPKYLIPSAYVLMLGGKIGFNLGVGAGLGGNFGWVIQPTLVVRYDKFKRRVKRYMTARGSVVMIPYGSLGGGVGGGAKARVGVGLVFGKLESPSELGGLYTAGSFSMVAGIGLSVKGGIVFRKGNKSNLFFANALYDSGVSAGINLHGNAGPILNIKNMRDVINTGLHEFGTEVEPGETKGEFVTRVREKKPKKKSR